MASGLRNPRVAIAVCAFALALSICISGVGLLPSPDDQVPESSPTTSDDSSAGSAPETSDSSRAPIIGFLTMHPGVLNLKSEGKYVSGSLELPKGVLASEVFLPSVRLNGLVYAETCFGHQISDLNGNKVPDLMLKFLKQDAKTVLIPGDSVTVFVTGIMNDGTPIYASGVITVMG